MVLFSCGAVQNAPCHVGRHCGDVCHCAADGTNMQARVKNRIIGNVAKEGCFAFWCSIPFCLPRFMPISESMAVSGVGFSVKYGWQAVFNTFGALAIAEELYGLKGAVGLRVAQNVFGVVFALLFCVAFYWVMERVTGRRIAGGNRISNAENAFFGCRDMCPVTVIIIRRYPSVDKIPEGNNPCFQAE